MLLNTHQIAGALVARWRLMGGTLTVASSTSRRAAWNPPSARLEIHSLSTTFVVPNILLDESEIRALAGGYRRADKQLNELHARGFSRTRRSPLSGRVVLEHSHYPSVTGGNTLREAQNGPRPNWTKVV